MINNQISFLWEKASVPLELELLLQRIEQSYSGTNGDLSGPFGPICHTIELPWKNNMQQESCVRAGRYRVLAIVSPKRGICLALVGVPGRGDIELHKANRALLELKGCIAPVTTLTGTGTGISSGDALAKLEALCFPMLAAGRKVWLTINDVINPT